MMEKEGTMTQTPAQNLSTSSSTDATSGRRPIVVGVDGSLKSSSAVTWAADEASRRGCPLAVVLATGDFIGPTPRLKGNLVVGFDYDSHFEKVVEEVAQSVVRRHPDLPVRQEVCTGAPLDVLRSQSASAEMVVIGKQGLGALARLFAGSTSIGLAADSSAPVVVVPDIWEPVSGDEQRSIVVGIAPEHDNSAVLSYAFARAESLDVPLVAVYAWQFHPSFLLTEDDSARRGLDAARMLNEELAPWRDKFVGVDASAVQCHDAAAEALLKKSEHAGLIVLGQPAHGSFARHLPGSVSRAVLHYAHTPIALVPSGQQ